MASKTYKIIQTDGSGRYMVANKNLKQGELILKEAPVLVGPQLNGPARCFKCLTTINLMMCSFCDNCNTALMCTNNCEGIYHTDNECMTLRTQKIKGQLLAENPSAIFPLRCLLLSIYNPERFEEILKMEAHLDKRRDTAIWRRHRLSVEDVLKDTNLISQKDLKDELVQRICGILDVNAFEIRPPNLLNLNLNNPETQCLRGLYPLAALMDHNCMSNTHFAVDDNFLMSVYASVDIKENEPIFNNYANVLQGNQERQQHLLEGKYFSCKCKRCKDPTELGTEISSLICHKCRKGFLRYTEIEEGFKIWKCSECQLCFKDFLINLAIEEGRRRIDDLGIQDMEELYKKLLLTFHPNHYLLLELKQNMVGLYSKLPPTRNNLNRKIDLCGRLMSVFSKLDPGISRVTALTTYELQSALVDILNKQYRDKEIGEEELVTELQTAERILKDCVKYLLYEPPKSPEGRMALLALNELKMLRNSIKNIQKDVLIGPNKEETGDKKAEITKRLKDKLEKNKEKAKNGVEEKENVREKSVGGQTVENGVKESVNNASNNSGKRKNKKKNKK